MNRPSTRPAQHGFSLTEFMIAMTIGLIILAAMGTVYLSSKRSFRMQDNSWQLQDSGRFALEYLVKDLRMTGFRGCNSSSITPVNTLNNSTAFDYDFSVDLQGFEATGSSTWSPALNAAITSTSPAPLGGRDVITVRRALEGAVGVTAPFMTDTSAALHVDSNNGLRQSDIVLVTDCTAAAILQISNADPDTSGNIAHNTGAATSPGNATKDLGKVFGGDAEVMKLTTVTYFVAPSALVPGSNSLWRRKDGNAPEELAQGVDDLQILYGEDIDGDHAANRYVPANSVTDMTHVVSLKISLLTASLQDNVTSRPQPYVFNGATITPADHRLRRVYTSVISLRNRTP
jgi:type IV pilus assembly protein PilW